jgi:hypothetical protein
MHNFRVDESFMPIWDEFRQICFQEGESASEKIREFIMRYVMVHSEGNPQLLLSKFMDDLPKSECFYCHGHFEKLKKVKYKSGLVAPTCEVCLSLPAQKNCMVRVLGDVV